MNTDIRQATLRLRIDGTGAADGARQFDEAGQRIKRTGDSIKFAMAAIGASTIALTGKFIGMAGDANEIRSKFNVVFRGMEDDAEKWATAFGDSVGRSTEEIQKHMAGLQDVFVPLGYARDDAMRLSEAVTQLAVDVASFNNAADADVIRDFTSAMVGNHETVRKYGIVISEARLEQEAYESGLHKTYRQLSDLEKATLRLKIIQESSSDAMGDATRTADQYANQTKRLKANVEELGVSLGDKMLPAANKALTGLNTWLESNRSAIDRWARNFQEGISIITGAMDKLHQKAFEQSDIKTLFESLGPWSQKSMMEAYESQTGESFGYKTIAVPGIMGGAAAEVWQDPRDADYARRLIASYQRAMTRREQGSVTPPAQTPAGDGAQAIDLNTLLTSSSKQDPFEQLGDAMAWPGDQLAKLTTRMTAYAEQAQKADTITGSYVDELQFEAKIVSMSEAEQRKAIIVRQAQAEAIADGTVLLGEHVRAIEYEIDALTKAEEQADRMKAIGEEVGSGFARGFQEATRNARNLSDALDYIGDAAMNVVDRVMELTIWEPMAQSISGAVTKSLTPRASGGRVYPGTGYWVGEMGPEPFFPDEPGTIVPNSQAMSRMAATPAAPNVQINVSNSSQANVEATAPDVHFDGKRLVVGMLLKDRRNNGMLTRSQGRS